jgi:hypothetical protein
MKKIGELLFLRILKIWNWNKIEGDSLLSTHPTVPYNMYKKVGWVEWNETHHKICELE